MERKSSIECGFSISAFAPARELSPFHDDVSAAEANLKNASSHAAKFTTPYPSKPTSTTFTRAPSMLTRSANKLERRASWLSSALSSDNLPFAVVDIEKEERRRSLRSMLLSTSAAVFYSICAISMNFTNKAALMAFPFANTLLLLQMLAALAVVLPLRALGLIYFPPFNATKARVLLPLTALYAGNVSCALLGLRVLNVPMYSTLKRLTPLLVILAKWRMTKTLPSNGICCSVLIVVLGCFIAGSKDLAFDLRGYTFAFASCMLQAAYLLLVERTGAKTGVATSELLAYNAILSLPFILGAMVVSGEAFHVLPALHAAMAQHGTFRFMALLVLCSLSGVALNFSMFLCTLLNSALTTTIVGTLKGVIVTVLGFFLLGGVPHHSALNISGIVVNALGGTLYSIIKYRARLSTSSISTSATFTTSSKGNVSPTEFSSTPSSSTTLRSLINGAHSRRDSLDGTDCSPSSVLAAYHAPPPIGCHVVNTGGNHGKRSSIDGSVYVPTNGKPPLPFKTGNGAVHKVGEVPVPV